MDQQRLQELVTIFYQEMQNSTLLQDHIEDHRRRSERVHRLLTTQHIPQLTEAELRELFFDSDAFGFWGNKEWEFNDRLQKTGLEEMRNILLELITRAEQGLKPEDLRAIWEMKGLGTLLSTEFLAYRYPDRYWTYSANVTLTALQKLGDNVRDQMPRGQKSNPYLYFAIESRLVEIRSALQNVGLPNVDNLVADIFLWWVNKNEEMPASLPDETAQDLENQSVVTLPASPRQINKSASIDINNVKQLIELANLLTNHIACQNLYFTPWQIATFYTALQTKGFVILSGISGTGKTKLAQAFADALPQPAQREVALADDVIAVTVQPYMRKYGRLIIPKQATRLFDPPPPGESQDVALRFENTSQVCRFVHASYGSSDYLSLLFRGKARQWFVNTFAEGDTVVLQPELNKEDTLAGFQIGTQETLAAQTPTKPAGDGQRNVLFVPVRTDWRDSKSLLGYYNPLTGTYEWTPFLRFLLRAVQSYRARDGLAWFVILDEMNLARVEYYFADLLSVLESGRTTEGWTREPLRLSYPDTAEGDLPPKELPLPPNIYVVGTVNVDETTHAFSPKVLDRAFTLELTDADFSRYPATTSTPTTDLDDTQRQTLLQTFTNNGAFARIDKAEIAAYVAGHPATREHLRALNALLHPYDMHFGYRVFDEIIAFLLNAEHNSLYDTLSGDDPAFDAAVLMKVLPKFHGSRGKLEQPLKQVLAWCLDPDTPSEDTITNTLKNIETSDDTIQKLADLPYRYPRTATRVQRMLWALYTSGFAAFG